jgi:hypothetical protein
MPQPSETNGFYSHARRCYRGKNKNEKINMRFGIIQGIKLFVRFQLGYVTNIKVPEIKYQFSLRHGTSDISVFYQISNNFETWLTKVKTMMK